jgi:hypothetical protein
LDGLSNIYTIQANIDALKNAQGNSSAALNNQSQVDPDTFLYQTALSFNQMLDSLVSPSDDEKEKNSSDLFGFLGNSQESYIENLTKQQTATTTQQAQSSPLIGRTATYYDPATGEEKNGVINKVSFDRGGQSLILADGTELPAGAVTGLK